MSNIIALSVNRLLKSRDPFRYIIWAGLMIIPFALFVYSSQSSHCSVYDQDSISPTEMKYFDFTRAEACNKAMAMCSYFSRDPKKCSIKP